MMRRLLAPVLILAACARPRSDAPDAAVEAPIATPLPASPSATSSATGSPARDLGGTVFSPVGARRVRSAKSDDRAISANAELVKKHFGGALPSPIVVESVELSTSPK